MGELIRREAASAPLPFSGERLTSAASGRQVEIEHYHRYLLARDFCRGRDVLDVASGEGYGTALLAQVARSVVGIEIDPAVVAAARAEFARPHLRYEQGDARALPLPDASVDVVVSFETLEHILEQDVFIGELRRVLRPGGLVVMSTPDRDVYSPVGTPPNPYHVLELTRAEFEVLLLRHFAYAAFAVQRAVVGSLTLGAVPGVAPRVFERRGDTHIEANDHLPRAPYVIALASDGALPPLPDSVYVHRGDLDIDIAVRAHAEERLRAVEAQRAIAEGEKAQAQVERNQAEAARTQAEAEKAQARAERNQAEAARAQAEGEKAQAQVERNQAEAARTQAEAEKAQARAERNQAEAARAQAEVEKAQARVERNQAETARAQAEAKATEERMLAQAERVALGAAEASRAAAQQSDRQIVLDQKDAEIASLATRAIQAEEYLRAVFSSTCWRLTAPLRYVGSHHPILARYVRRSARLVWWVVTLQIHEQYHAWRSLRGQRVAPPARRGCADLADLPASPATRVPRQWLPPAATAASFLELERRTEPVDIVICVHNALESVRACVESVLRCTTPPYRVIVVDDGSGPETASYLDDQVREQGVSLLRNGGARGYTHAANVGLSAVTAPWVVLLNSDAVVSPDWLDRMWVHGARDPSIGVIGPLSNTASWQSVPRIFEGEDWAGNPLPPGVSVDDMGSLAASGAIGAVPMPFINGFCYMIRSALLESVGLFDGATFGAGYGEENDLSIRVRKAGWSLVVATDAYVYHAQSMSYSNDRRIELAKRSDQLLLEKHDPRLHIWPQVTECHDSLAMASIRARLSGALQGRELVRRGRTRFEGRRIAFVLPIAERGGGASVIVQESKALQCMGVDVTLLNLEQLQRALGPAPELESLDVRTFANPEAITTHLIRQQDRYDAVIATLYRGVYWLPLHANFRLGYYVQDFEPYFFPESSPEYGTALLSYSYSDRIRLLTKTLWNQKEVALWTGRRAALLGPSVETTAFAPDPTRRAGGPVRIAAMVRPSTPRRAPGRTLSILERVLGRLDGSISVTIFGSNDDELDAAGLGRAWAKNAGRLDRSGMGAVLAGADIFLDCSDYQAMGLTALEAMLSGCAVVAPQRGGCNDFIRTGVNGVLVDSTDEAACAEAVLHLTRDAGALRAIRARAVEDAGSYIPERAALRLLEAMFDG